MTKIHETNLADFFLARSSCPTCESRRIAAKLEEVTSRMESRLADLGYTPEQMVVVMDDFNTRMSMLKLTYEAERKP